MSEVKVNKISPRSGTTVTLGDSGDTFTIPSGATINNQGTATNFGATGSASWNTTVKTSTFTAVAGEGYFVNTTGGVVTVNLPAGTAGAVVAIKDYAGTFDTNKVTLVQNGSDKIGGSTVNATLDTEGIAVTLVFIDSTQGWLVTDSGLQSEAPGPQYVAASGGNTTLTVCSHKVHIFTGPGTLCVSAAGNSAGSNSIEYLVVAGSAGGTSDWAGGSGAGGWRSYSALPSAHPLNAPAALPVSVQGYPITVGGSGSVGAGGGANELGGNGSSSVFSTITSAGGGRAGNEGTNSVGAAGGSGGGGGTGGGPGCGCGGAGNTPPTNPAQGSSGGDNSSNTTGYTAGGGGAGGTGEGCGSGSVPGGAGGVGAYVVDGFIGPTAPSYGTPGPVGSTRYFSGGGGGAAGSSPRTGGAGGAGGGGAGAVGPAKGTAGTVNTGGGGGGGSGNESPNPGSGGGSGIVMIRYKFQE